MGGANNINNRTPGGSSELIGSSLRRPRDHQPLPIRPDKKIGNPLGGGGGLPGGGMGNPLGGGGSGLPGGTGLPGAGGSFVGGGGSGLPGGMIMPGSLNKNNEGGNNN